MHSITIIEKFIWWDFQVPRLVLIEDIRLDIHIYIHISCYLVYNINRYTYTLNSNEL